MGRGAPLVYSYLVTPLVIEAQSHMSSSSSSLLVHGTISWYPKKESVRERERERVKERERDRGGIRDRKREKDRLGGDREEGEIARIERNTADY